eukprot:m.35840 g.35840  ORF g.35840 m.35840 type:complete len:327 (-) comp8970_c0_seq3:76-1056(-)
MALPVVCVVNNLDRNDDLDSVDPAIAKMLEGKAKRVSLKEALEIRAGGGDIDGVLTLCHAHVDGDLLDSLGSKVKVVSNYGVGVDHIDLPACTVRSVVVGHTPNVLNEAVADFAFTLLLAAARRIVKADKYARSEEYKAYSNMVLLGKAVHGTTMGIVGMGRIGTGIAQRGIGFGMKILYHNRSRNENAEKTTGAVKVPLDELLEQSDYIVLICPSTPETRHLINSAAFKKMKNTATLVNVARGPVVDTEALTQALKDGEIDSAGLDVFDPEPLPRDHPLNSMENVIMAPHRGSATAETRRAMAEVMMENLLLGLAGKPLIASPSY